MNDNHIILIGHRSSGKTRIFQRLSETNSFITHPSPTDKIEQTVIHISGKDYHLYDTPGTKTPILIPILQKATLILLVYESTHHYAYHNISTWLEFISHYTTAPIILVSDQIDFLTNTQKRLQLSFFSEWVKKQIWVDSIRGRHLSAIHDAITEYNTPLPIPITIQTPIIHDDPGCFYLCPLRWW